MNNYITVIQTDVELSWIDSCRLWFIMSANVEICESAHVVGSILIYRKIFILNAGTEEINNNIILINIQDKGLSWIVVIPRSEDRLLRR